MDGKSVDIYNICMKILENFENGQYLKFLSGSTWWNSISPLLSATKCVTCATSATNATKFGTRQIFNIWGFKM